MHQLPAPPNPRQPWPAADAGYVNFGRSGVGCLLLGVGLLLFFTGCAAAGAIWPDQVLTNGGAGGERVIATVIAVVFGTLSLFMLVSLPAALRNHGLAADRYGVWYVTKKRAEPVPWQQVRAIGGSWTWKRRTYKSSLGARIGQEIARKALTDDGRQHFAVEVFLHDPASVEGHKRLALLQSTTRKERPPRPDLPGARLRFRIRGISDYQEMVNHLHRCAPGLWIGEYQRHVL